MLRTIHLHGALAVQFGPSFDLDVKNPIEALRALIVQIKGFRRAFREGSYRVLKARAHVAESLGLEELQLRLGRARDIHVVPVIAGSANGWGKVLAGVAIIGLAIAAPYALGLMSPVTGSLAIGSALSTTAFGGITFGNIAALGAAVALSRWLKCYHQRQLYPAVARSRTARNLFYLAVQTT